MAARALGLALLAALSLGGCATVEKIEGSGFPSDTVGAGFSNPGAREGSFELDSELCWQSIQPESDSAAAPQQAYEACMRSKGWSHQP